MKYLINFHFSFTYQDILKLYLATSYFWLKTYADSNNNTEGIFNIYIVSQAKYLLHLPRQCINVFQIQPYFHVHLFFAFHCTDYSEFYMLHDSFCILLNNFLTEDCVCSPKMSKAHVILVKHVIHTLNTEFELNFLEENRVH